ncbi:MAG: methylated-DNA--[protein]-cysteine S-methyltransferase [Phenylobacterium sp.]|uniref:methylated-DNA--[protein]-cysteine S-methyltransferase n=1 Tax=Phenylobacterium sp. TaxID=1871053 RepID=UPI003918CF27
MSAAVGYSLFPTELGLVGIAWSEAAIVGVQLPEASEAAARARLARRHPAAQESEPPPSVREAIEGVRRLMAGEKPKLQDIELDYGAAPELHRRIYAVVRAIPPGRTMTYGEIARAVGEPHAAQAVGQAMGRNPCPILMPCHRVLGADGRIGGFSAPGGVSTKRRLLEMEGATSVEALPLFAAKD